MISTAVPRAPAALAPPATRMNPLLLLHNVAAALSVLLVALQLRGGSAGEVAALVAVPLAAAAAFAADRRYLPVLLILAIPSMGVIAGRDAVAVMASGRPLFVFPEATIFVQMGGVEVTAPLVVLAAAFARVGVEVLRGGPAFRGVVPGWLLAAFLLSLLPALASGLTGQSLGYNRWSQGPRAMLALGGLFWGMVVVHRAGPATGRLSRQLAWVVLAGATLLVVRFLSGTLLFILVGFAGGLIPYFVSRRRIVEAGICAVAIALAVVGMTLTTAAQALVSLGCVVVAAPRFRALGKWLVRLGILAACLLSMGMIWAVMQLQGKTLLEVATRDEGVVAYAIFKLMGDRGPLWLASVEQIAASPLLVVPAGRPLRPESFDYGGLVYLWEFGAHNAVLELVRNVGMAAGAVGVVLMGFGILSAVRVLLSTGDAALRGVAAGFLGVSIAGITTGNFPVYDVGWFLWAVAGMLAGAWRISRRAADGDEDEAEAGT